MKATFHPANSRGHANHGWLNSYHSFSFANYYNPERMNFGALRVLNDDTVAPGKGFGTHPHKNMEIISIPLSGDLEHADSMGNKSVIKQGEVQVMSAGTGIEHSEYNRSESEEVKFLQIWVIPKDKDVEPRYDQISLRTPKIEALEQIVSPLKDDDGAWINQDAWFYMADLKKDQRIDYRIHKMSNGLYIFNLNGKVEVEGKKMDSRDGLGLWETKTINLYAEEDARLLLMEVPMQF